VETKDLITKKSFVLVLGCHRSGTSVTTKVLEILGCNLGEELLVANPEFNPLGHFENLAALEFNENLLKQLGTDWRDPQPLSSNRSFKEIKQSTEVLLDKLVLELLEKGITALKEPRITFLLDLWAPVLEKHTNLKIVVAMRHPSEVASSLLQRDSLETILGLQLWAQATINSLKFARKHINHFVFYDELLSQPNETVIALAKSLQMPVNYESIDDFLAMNIMPGLKHHFENESNESALEIVNSMYEYIKNFSNATYKDFPDELLDEWQSSLDLSIHAFDRKALIRSEPEYRDYMTQHLPTDSPKVDFHNNLDKVMLTKLKSTGLPYPLRYAFLLHSPYLGGAERSSLELIEKLIQYGNTVNCFVPEGSNEIIEMLRIAGAQVHVLASLTWWTSDVIMAIQQTKEIQLLLEKIKVDLVVTKTGVIPQGAIAARKLGIPHVWFLHEFLDIDHGLKVPFNRDAFSKIVLDYSDKVICNSNSVREHFFPESHDKVVTAKPYPQISEHMEAPVSRKMRKPLELGLIANFNPGKGHLILLAALAKLNETNFNVRVKFFGDGGTQEFRGQIDSFIKQNSLLNKVSFRGFVSSRKEIYESIDAVVVPSLNEGFGRVPFEAMSYGVPVIYSASGALTEYMIPDKTGLAFEVNNPISLATSIRELANADFDCSHLIKNGWTFVKEIHDAQSTISDVMDICQMVVQNYSKKPLQDETAILINEFSQLTHQRDELKHQRDELTHQREELLNSTIWKVTQPIRNLINLFKK
jgi:glycosyltransferase involved in cell wall biosynthesis